MATQAQTLSRQLAMIDGYLLDCELSSSHQFESEITNYPTESGSNVVDNIRPKPITVSMTVIVTNSPIGEIASQRDKVSEPADEAYQRLQKIYLARKPVTIRTSLDTFTNMALKNLTVPRESGRGDDLTFTAEWQQIQTVTNKRFQRVSIPAAMISHQINKPVTAWHTANKVFTINTRDLEWLDPDIEGFRKGALFDGNLGLWTLYKGRPLVVPYSDWQQAHRADSYYLNLNRAKKKNGKAPPLRKDLLVTTIAKVITWEAVTFGDDPNADIPEF